MIDKNKINEKYSAFDREYKRVEPYKSRRPLTSNVNKRIEYRECLVRTYNDLISSVTPQSLQELHGDEKIEILSQFTGYLTKLKDCFKALSLKYNFEKGVFNKINIELIIESSELDDTISESDSEDATPSQSKQIQSQNEQDKLHAAQEQQIEQVDVLNNFQFTEHTMAQPQTPSDFIALAHRMINNKYAGDPLALDSFIDAIELLKDLCEDHNKAIFLKFVMTRLEGLARESILTTPETVDAVVRQLRDGIKTESSKVIEGRILALRADRSSLMKFSEQAEKLAEQFKRSLCLEGFSREKAKEIAIEKTVEMCRKSSKNDTVKAVLAASSFSEPKEVIAKMIIEINNLKHDKPSTSYSHKFGNSNKNSGNHNGNSNRGNGNGHHNNRNGQPNRNGHNNNRFNNNGQNNGNRSNYNSNNRFGNNNQGHRNNNSQNYTRSGNDQNVRVISGNDEHPGNGGLQMN